MKDKNAARSGGGLFRCPMCEKAHFFTEEDLLHHIKAHAIGYENKLVKARPAEEEEEEE